MAKPKTSRDDSMISALEAGIELGVGPTRVRVLIREGRLPAIRIGKTWIIRRGDLDLVRDRRPGRPRTKAGDKPQPSTKKPKPTSAR